MTPDLISAQGSEATLNLNTIQPNGERVKELRRDRGWTEEELGDKAGYSKRTIETIEASRPVRPGTLLDVAETLGVKLEQIALPFEGTRTLTCHSGFTALPPPVQARFGATGEQAPNESQPAGPDRKCSLLVVDDEPMVLQILTHLLSREYDVVTADSAAAAEVHFARQPIDLILTDQRMPQRSGAQLLEWVQEHYPRTVRLLMTGYVELDDTIEAINRGHVHYYVAKPFRQEAVFQALRNAAEKCELERKRDQLIEGLCQSSRELEEAHLRLLQHTRELERVAMTDSLTGLFNRRAIEELARFELKRHVRYPSPLSIGLLRIDPIDLPEGEDFQSGSEEVLEELGRILARLLRETDSVGRLHGEKFLVIARETGPEGAAHLAERIQTAVAASCFKCNGQPLRITLSIGFAVAAAGVHADLEKMLASASAAWNAAKTGGPNRCEVRRVSAPVGENGA